MTKLVRAKIAITVQKTVSDYVVYDPDEYTKWLGTTPPSNGKLLEYLGSGPELDFVWDLHHGAIEVTAAVPID